MFGCLWRMFGCCGCADCCGLREALEELDPATAACCCGGGFGSSVGMRIGAGPSAPGSNSMIRFGERKSKAFSSHEDTCAHGEEHTHSC